MKSYHHGVKHNFKISQIVKIKATGEPRRIRDITAFGGLYLSGLLREGGKRYSATSVYYSPDEVYAE